MGIGPVEPGSDVRQMGSDMADLLPPQLTV